MGGAMDLVAGVKKVVVVMEQVNKAKDGHEEAKLLQRCTLPLTGSGVIDLVITDLGVFSIDKKNRGGVALLELAPGVTLEESRRRRRRASKSHLVLRRAQARYCEGERPRGWRPRLSY